VKIYRGRLAAVAAIILLIAMAAIALGCQQPETPAAQTPAATARAATSAGPEIQTIEATINSPEKAKAEATSDAIAFAWNLFMFNNWPALTTSKGQPDSRKSFGAPGPVVWQTYKTSQDMYVVSGQPLPWNQGPIVEPPALQSGMIDGKILTDRNGNPVMYEVRLSEDTYNYILGRGLYTQAGQLQLLKGGPPVTFPLPSMEIKAAWRFLGKGDDPTHYFTTKVQDGGVVRILGLSGLHITSKALPQWVWCTFEQIENLQTTGARLLLPIAAAVQQSNKAMQSGFAGTPWAYYQLDGVQTEYVQNPDAAACLRDPKVTCLANTQIETNFQGSSSCITCHSLASIGPNGRRFNLWSFRGGNQQGHMGDPPPLKPDVGLDFVWSMREAH